MPQECLRELTLGAVLLDREATRGALEETGTLGTVLPTALMSLAFLKAGFTARLTEGASGHYELDLLAAAGRVQEQHSRFYLDHL